MKVCVCGAAGGIGQPLSLLLKMSLPSGSSLSLYDVVPSLTGVAVDLLHISTGVKLEYFIGDMKNPNNADVDKALKDADIVVIPAGVPRKPGMTRDDLFKVNAGILKGLIEAVARNCPKAFIAIITNPVNSMVPVAAELLKLHKCYDPKKLFGVSTLDVVRAQTFVGELKAIDPAKVKVNVIGGHSPETMLTVLSGVEGTTFTDQEHKELTQKIADAGTAVVNAKDGAGSATLSMAYAALRFTSSLVRAFQGEKGVVECAYVAVEKMEVDYCALPVEIGKHGIENIHPVPKLNDAETSTWKTLIPILQKNIETGVAFVKESAANAEKKN
jgi:malate dehydrogenase